MNRCTYLDEFFQEHNRPTPREFQGHRSKVKVTWVFGCFRCAWWCGYPRTVLSLEQGL